MLVENNFCLCEFSLMWLLCGWACDVAISLPATNDNDHIVTVYFNPCGIRVC